VEDCIIYRQSVYAEKFTDIVRNGIIETKPNNFQTHNISFSTCPVVDQYVVLIIYVCNYCLAYALLSCRFLRAC
jgi:hypothetical protein